MIKLVAFDWNGTIFADTFAIYKSNKEVLKSFGLTPVSFKTFQKYYEVPIKGFYLALGFPEKQLRINAKLINSTFHAHYEMRISKIRTRAGAKEVLRYLLKNNIASVIFSNHIAESIKKQLKRLKLEGYFLDIIANSHIESALWQRSKKERLEKYMNIRKIFPDEVLIVGDTTEEIEIGKELGVQTAALTHGNCSIVRLKTARPDYLIYSLKEVIKIIHNL